mmetsp:Transcript_4754/g.10724  ORF Transcript_4754/g.10724 Transcript_4754/m.10724 type:complete len:126 (+) Transcript_4754:1303-1680(+)
MFHASMLVVHQDDFGSMSCPGTLLAQELEKYGTKYLIFVGSRPVSGNIYVRTSTQAHVPSHFELSLSPIWPAWIVKRGKTLREIYTYYLMKCRGIPEPQKRSKLQVLIKESTALKRINGKKWTRQ